MSYSFLDPEADRPAVAIMPPTQVQWATLPADQLVRKVAAVVAGPFGVRSALIFSRDRTERAVAARHATVAICREVGGLSSVELGRLMKRDHAAILYALNSVRDRLSTDRLFCSRYGSARRAMGLPPI